MKLNKQSLSNENGGLCALFWGSWLWGFCFCLFVAALYAFNGSFHVYMYVSQLQIATTKERAHSRAQCMYRCTRGWMHARADSLAPCDLCLKAARKMTSKKTKQKTTTYKHFLVFEYCYYTMEYDTTLLSTWENSFDSTMQNDD